MIAQIEKYINQGGILIVHRFVAELTGSLVCIDKPVLFNTK